jgi:hypothetical protein
MAKTYTCLACGATTTDPTHALIVYFHDNCPATKKVSK